MSTNIQYPKAQFSVEPYRYQNPIHTGGYNNHHPVIGQKIVFPGFVPVQNVLTYRLQLATVFQGTECESDFCSSTRPTCTIRGVGASQQIVVNSSSDIVHDGIEIVSDSLSGIGGIPAMVRKLYRHAYKNVVQSNTMSGHLCIGNVDYARIKTDVSVLLSPNYLPRNGFLGSTPDQGSMVLFVDMQIVCTAEQVQTILHNSNNISSKYDRAHRIVMRIDSDESDLIATTRHPAACVYWHFTERQDGTVSENIGAVPHAIEQVQYLKNKS